MSIFIEDLHISVKKYDLKVHVMKHTGENPHKCEVCSKGFRSERHLVDHARTHTGMNK